VYSQDVVLMDADQVRKRIVYNRAQCRVCQDMIESKHRHDFVNCQCGAISVDGGKDYLKRSFKRSTDLIELSFWEEL
jgi:hypothetical protein